MTTRPKGLRARPLAFAVAVCCALLAAPLASGASSAKLASLVRGGVDLDVMSASGVLLGTVRGSIAASGKGVGGFRPAAGKRRADVVVVLRGSLQGPSARLALRGRGLTGSVRVAPDGTAAGAGKLGGARVSLAGVVSDDRPDIARGMKLLVVGTPSGEAWDALKKAFEPVSYRRFVHTRQALLEDRDGFHEFAGIVFGRGLSAKKIAAHPLLHTFVNGGKWVIVAPATEARLNGLAGVHPYDPNRPAAAVAVRSVGPEGDHDRVKPTVIYPEAGVTHRATGTRALSVSSTGEPKARVEGRQKWFIAQLEQLGKAAMRTARTTSGARTQASSSQFSLPYNAAAIEIAVPFRHEFTVSGAYNLVNFTFCAWNEGDDNTWCPDTWFYKQFAGPNQNDTSVACNYFRPTNYLLLARDSAHAVYTVSDPHGLNSDGAYTVRDSSAFHHSLDDESPAWVLTNSDNCPSDGAQTGIIQGTDTYFAIYDPGLDQHTLIVTTDPTVSAAENGQLWRNNANNGTGHLWGDYCLDPICDTPALGPYAQQGMKETAWILAAYAHTLSLSGPQVGALNFEYSGAQSFPQSAISVADLTSGKSDTTSVSVGIFGDQGTITYSDSQTVDSSVSVQAPNWQVAPTPQGGEITYMWTTEQDGNSDPLSFATMQTTPGGGLGASFVPNDLNIADFNPASVTVWSGAATYGPVSVSSTRTLYMADHFVWWSQSNHKLEDYFTMTPVPFNNDNPNATTPKQKNPVGPGINLCDGAVMAPEVQDQCAGTGWRSARGRGRGSTASRTCAGRPGTSEPVGRACRTGCPRPPSGAVRAGDGAGPRPRGHRDAAWIGGLDGPPDLTRRRLLAAGAGLLWVRAPDRVRWRVGRRRHRCSRPATEPPRDP
ncbi:MAG: hypothetical protein R3C15_01705 [Thermoleophilia bacterium]